MNVVTVNELTKIYHTGMKKGGITALDTVTLQIEPGEIFGLLGPNGAGKTTLFKLLLGISSVTSGEATLLGYPPSNPKSREKIGYLPENHRFPDHLTGLGLLMLTGRMFNLKDGVISKRADELLKLVDMTKWANTKIKKYSKGMLQRVGLAQAMINDPEVLFLDEPTDGVDPVGRAEIKNVMQKIRDDGKTIILNSHLLSEVEMVADRVAILQNGKLAKIGSVDEMTNKKLQYEIQAEFRETLFDIPSDIGKLQTLSRGRMVVELVDESKINW
ncbi:MAG TPA: ABC transporter ATP-binding protein, partial [candidate division Zixibacteria bacterium]|nr:ABC transporter ATP-binding protein [candidate division Zixibacteria bacterium]